MPRLSPSASRSAAPRARAQSSTVWCSSICRSPLHSRLQREAAVPRDLLQHVIEEPKPVATSRGPSRDRSSSTPTSVSLVLRWTLARAAPRPGCARDRRPGLLRARRPGARAEPWTPKIGGELKSVSRSPIMKLRALSIGWPGEIVPHHAELGLAAVALLAA